MEVDKCKEIRRYYNCRETGHLIARCSKLRKERSKEVRIVKEVREDFFLDRK